MPFYRSSLNVFEVLELEVWQNPRDFSDFLIPISEQEFREIKNRRTPRAADVCQSCGAIDQFTFTNIKDSVQACLVCGTHR